MSSNEEGISKPALIITLVLVLVILIGGGFFLKNRLDQLTAEPTPTPASNDLASTETPVPEPTPSFDRSGYTLRVLNGTKTSGLAGTVSDKLKELGYEVSKTGNATSSAIARTTIRVKDGSEELLNQLKQDLSADYQAASGSALKTSDDADAEIIIGDE